MPAPKKNPLTNLIKKGAKKAVVKVKPKPKAPTDAATKRGLKAANKPTNRVGSKADRKLRSRTKSVNMSKEETKAIYDFYYGKGTGDDVTQVNKRTFPVNESRSARKNPYKKKK